MGIGPVKEVSPWVVKEVVHEVSGEDLY